MCIDGLPNFNPHVPNRNRSVAAQQQSTRYGGQRIGQNVFNRVCVFNSETDGVFKFVVLLVDGSVQPFVGMQQAVRPVEQRIVDENAKEQLGTQGKQRRNWC